MILHINFTDGSNPWVSLPSDRHAIAKLWRQWTKNHPDTARQMAVAGAWRCCYCRAIGQYIVYCKERWGGYYYRKLGNALAALERLGG